MIEAPAGSIVLYDARIWHRQGQNRTGEVRPVILQSLVPRYVMPFIESGRIYRAFRDSTGHGELSRRERRELKSLFVHTIHGGPARRAVDVDRKLTTNLDAAE